MINKIKIWRRNQILKQFGETIHSEETDEFNKLKKIVHFYGKKRKHLTHQFNIEKLDKIIQKAEAPVKKDVKNIIKELKDIFNK